MEKSKEQVEAKIDEYYTAVDNGKMGTMTDEAFLTRLEEAIGESMGADEERVGLTDYDQGIAFAERWMKGETEYNYQYK